jgi:hypothetical protein
MFSSERALVLFQSLYATACVEDKPARIWIPDFGSGCGSQKTPGREPSFAGVV